MSLPSITQSTGMRDIVGIMGSAKDRQHVKTSEDGGFKLGYSSLTGQIKYSRLDNKHPDTSGLTQRDRHNIETRYEIGNTLKRAGAETVSSTLKNVLEGFGSERDRQSDMVRGFADRESRDRFVTMLESRVERAIGNHIRAQHWFDPGAERVTVAELRQVVSEVDSIVHDTLRSVLSRVKDEITVAHAKYDKAHESDYIEALKDFGLGAKGEAYAKSGIESGTVRGHKLIESSDKLTSMSDFMHSLFTGDSKKTGGKFEDRMVLTSWNESAPLDKNQKPRPPMDQTTYTGALRKVFETTQVNISELNHAKGSMNGNDGWQRAISRNPELRDHPFLKTITEKDTLVNQLPIQMMGFMKTEGAIEDVLNDLATQMVKDKPQFDFDQSVESLELALAKQRDFLDFFSKAFTDDSFLKSMPKEDRAALRKLGEDYGTAVDRLREDGSLWQKTQDFVDFAKSDPVLARALVMSANERHVYPDYRG